MARAWDYMPGVPAAGHVTSGGAWHPGRANGCRKCEVALPCSNKTSYPTRQQAERAATRVPTRGGAVIQAYRCEHHDAWHIGHSRRSQ